MRTKTPRNDRDRVIRASEVGAYVYCARAWWLGSVEGVRPDDVRRLQTGSTVHEKHGRQVILGHLLIRLFYVLLILAGVAGLGWLMSSLVG
jgi:hypothetical protein